MKVALNLFRRFRDEEDGLALTEYLILLALLTGGVVLAIIAIGGSLNTAWTNWQTFFSQLAAQPVPSIT